MTGISNTTPTSANEGNIKGTIEISGVSASASNATVYVRVQETSRADASASTVAEQVIRGVDINPGLEPIPFEVRGIRHDPGGRYTVRVHVDVTNTGSVSRGDYVSTQSYPVELGKEEQVVTLEAKPVG